MKLEIKRIFQILGVIALIEILYATFTPLPYDPELPKEKWGAGASSVLPAHSGLQREFPALNGETSPEKAELGRMLFFDPILSKSQDTSCATCHNPSRRLQRRTPNGEGSFPQQHQFVECGL